MNEDHHQTELQSLVRRPIAPTPLGRFREGAAAPWVGLMFLNRHRQLWKYAAAPIAANLAITFVVLTCLGLAIAGTLGVVRPWLAGATAEWPAPAQWIAQLLVGGVLLILFLGAAFLLWRVLTGVLCGYFYERLAKRTEEMLGVGPDELRDLSLSYQIADTCFDLAALVAIHATFFLVGFVPLAGAPLAIAGDFSFTWFLFGADFFDFPLALRGRRRSEKRRFCRENLPHTLGLGAAVFVLQLVPFAGAVFLTTAVVGAVILHRRLTPTAESAAP